MRPWLDRRTVLLGGAALAALGGAGLACATRLPASGPAPWEALCAAAAGRDLSVPGYPRSPRAQQGHVRVRRDLPPPSVL